MERETGSVLGSLSLSSNGPDRESAAEKVLSRCGSDDSILSFIGLYFDRTPTIGKVTRIKFGRESFSVVEARATTSNGHHPGQEADTAKELEHSHIALSLKTGSNGQKDNLYYFRGQKRYNLYHPAVEMNLVQFLHLGRPNLSELNWKDLLLRSMGCLSNAVACMHDNEVSGIHIHDILVSYDKMFFANKKYSRSVLSQTPTRKASELIYAAAPY